MGFDPPIVVYDACVLYPFHLRNLLIELAVHDLVAARWTDAIHDEWVRSLVRARGIEYARLAKTRDLMKSVLPDADVVGWERHEGDLTLPDTNDRHVLAAAITARASIILTWNVKHFPPAALATHGITAQDPDGFLTEIYSQDPEGIAEAVDAGRANLRRSEPTPEDYLRALENQGLTSFISKIRASRQP